MCLRRTSVAACCVILLIPVLAFAGEEKPVALSAVPELVVKTVHERMDDVTLLSANTETEADGEFVYELQGRMKDGRKVEFDIYESGKVQEIEIEFDADMVPGAVMKAIERKLPGFKPVFIEASHSKSMKVTGYEFVGNLGQQQIDIEVSADGRNVVVADR